MTTGVRFQVFLPHEGRFTDPFRIRCPDMLIGERLRRDTPRSSDSLANATQKDGTHPPPPACHRACHLFHRETFGANRLNDSGVRKLGKSNNAGTSLRKTGRHFAAIHFPVSGQPIAPPARDLDRSHRATGPILRVSRPQAPQSYCWFWFCFFHFRVSSSPSSGTSAVRTRTPQCESPPR